MSAEPDRSVRLEGCFNFRDLGGYAGVDGRRIRWRTLFRADGLGQLSDADLEELRRLGLRTVIDLRSGDEIDRRGRVSLSLEHLAYHHLPMIDALPPDEELAEWARPAFVAGQYRDMTASGAAAIRAALEVLADAGSYPLAYHCMAGKDRTGILSALVLDLLGVADDDIVGDYALTNEATPAVLAWLRSTQPDRTAEADRNALAVLTAQPESMRLFLAGLRAEHGDVAGYVASLGLPGVGDALRAVLLEPAG